MAVDSPIRNHINEIKLLRVQSKNFNKEGRESEETSGNGCGVGKVGLVLRLLRVNHCRGGGGDVGRKIVMGKEEGSK